MILDAIEKLRVALGEMEAFGLLLADEQRQHCNQENLQAPAKGKPTKLQVKQKAIIDAGWDPTGSEIREAKELISEAVPETIERIQELTRVFRNRTRMAKKAIDIRYP